MSDAFGRTPEGLITRIRERVESLEFRLSRVLPGRLGSKGQETADWNFALEPGFYWSQSGALNAPYADNWVGYVEVISGGPAAGRLRQTLSVPTTGNSGRVTHSRVFSGTAWGAWKRSDNLMRPAAITGGTYDPATGRVNITAGSVAWVLDGVFTSEFRAYEVRWQIYSDTTWSPRIRLRSAGTEALGAYQWAMWDSTNGGSGGTNDSNIVPARVIGGGHSGRIELREVMYTAATANQKRWYGETYTWTNVHTTFSGALGSHDDWAFDGFAFFSGVGSPTVPTNAHSWISVKGVS